MLSFYSLESKSRKNDAETFAKGVASIVNKNFGILALGGGIDLFGDSYISKHPEHENCADALQVIMHFRLNSLEFLIQ